MSIEDAGLRDVSLPGVRDGLGRTDAVVVLGAWLRPDGSPSPALSRRIATAAELWRQGAAPVVVVSGDGGGRRTEAAVMAELLTARHHLPEAAVIAEERAADTLGNARETLALAREHGWRSLIVVTDGLHMPRALWCFRRLGRRLGITVRGAASPGPRRLSRAWCRRCVYEAVALVGYSWRLR